MKRKGKGRKKKGRGGKAGGEREEVVVRSQSECRQRGRLAWQSRARLSVCPSVRSAGGFEGGRGEWNNSAAAREWRGWSLCLPRPPRQTMYYRFVSCLHVLLLLLLLRRC